MDRAVNVYENMEASLLDPVQSGLIIDVLYRTTPQSMANKQNICKQGSPLHSSKVNLSRIESLVKDEDLDRILHEAKTQDNSIASSKYAKKRDTKKTLSRAESFAKDEDMDRILHEIEDRNGYSPSSKYAKKRSSVAGGEDVPLDEELKQFFVDVEKRNEELKELLQAMKCSGDENAGQLSRLSSASEKGSSESLVAKFMHDLGGGDNEGGRTITSDSSKTNGSCTEMKRISGSEQELDQMVAELLEL